MRALTWAGTARFALAVSLSVLVFSGCSSKPKTRQPVKLTSIEQVQVRPDETWSRSIGSGSEG